jgi:Peptidase family M23
MAAAVLFASGVAAALADSPPTTTVLTTTTAATTTEPVPTTTTEPTTVTTTAPTTTVAPPTTTAPAPTTTAAPPPPPPTTTAAPQVAAAPSYPLAPAAQCPVAALVIARPNRPPVVIGAATSARTRATRLATLVYPATGSIATAAMVSLAESSCTKRSGTAHAQIRSLSLFGGAVTATRLELAVHRNTSSTAGSVVIDGKRVGLSKPARSRLQSWGTVVSGSRATVPIAAGHQGVAALVIHLLRAHAGLPPGTTVLVAVAGVPAATGHRRPKAATHEPLKVTPPLEVHQLVFPVLGPAVYGDTYGGFRSDVAGNWHHGDDIFAPLGTPVVAVASGTINRVGWEKLGGWRLWVRDSVGDEFYYAHLSGYAPSDLRSNRVTAGQVIGFIGNTGDAFTTLPHLHFEVHPRPLLHLGYDGAVDPTTYLNSWPHVEHARVPLPTHPPLPKPPLLRREAAYVFRELLAARHVTASAPPANAGLHQPIPAEANGVVAGLPAREASGPAAVPADSSTLVVALLLGLVLIAFAAALIPASRRRLTALAFLLQRRRSGGR